MQSVSTFFKEENDIFYRKGERIGLEKGIEKGIEKNRHTVIENLLTKLGFSDEKAAEIAEVSIEYVKKIRASLEVDDQIRICPLNCCCAYVVQLGQLAIWRKQLTLKQVSGFNVFNNKFFCLTATMLFIQFGDEPIKSF